MRDYHRKKVSQSPLYKYEPWKITEEEFKVEYNHHNETIFALGNGYMGLRGTLEEEYTGPSETTTPGLYINGIYEIEDMIYGEKAPDLPEKRQTILNLADWTGIDLYLAREKFNMLKGEVSSYQRILDMKEGTLIRELVWTSPEGKRVQIKIVRFLSLTHKHIGVINYKVTPLNFDGTIEFSSSIDGDARNYHTLRNQEALKISDMGFVEKKGYIIQETQNSDISIGAGIRNRLSISNFDFKESYFIQEDKLVNQFKIEANKENEYCLTKYACLYTSLDIDRNYLKEQILNELESVVTKGWQKILSEHKNFLRNYWEDVDVKIYNKPALQQAFRFNAFHLLQSTSRDGEANIAAKGLTGEFYEGHYFWDTEIYILPFFLYSKPKIAKELLMYRYKTLDEARDNASRMKLNGALFPWRTINGEEASGFFMGSTIQYHINADIAYGIYQYYNATNDYEFLYRYGSEILVETARMWVSLGDYIPLNDNKFCFNEVCGPDEYEPGENNNCYTNYMAKFNLESAVKTIELMAEDSPHHLDSLKERVKLKDSEVEEWKKIIQDIYLPYNEELGIHPQDDSFLYKASIDVEDIDEEDIPLVRNWHPLIIWRYQVIKQADIILLMLLLGDQFNLEEKKANYDFYEPKTIHDSSLSPSIHSIIASEIGYYKDAYNYLLHTIRIDLDDYHESTYQGIHAACMASSWLVLVMGFAGMRNYNGQLYFNPYLPVDWDGYEFKIKFQNRQIKVVVKEDNVKYELLSGEELNIIHADNAINLNQSKKRIATKEL